MKTNEELRQDVLAEIQMEPLTSPIATQIGVATKEGVVTLSGLVDTYGQKLAAEQAAQRVAGVAVVAVDLEVKLLHEHQRNDTEIAEAAMNALKWHSAVNEDAIEIKVDNGWVYLDGVVEFDYLKKAAEIGLRNLTGIRGISNRIVVKPDVVASKDIKISITKALHRSAAVDAANIHVDVVGSKVKLTGKVRSLAEKTDAENASWSMPGVQEVENKVQVDTEL
ncbi:BON domain-containing protein [Chryseotalea sanaruensis]|uniref:BON domain-containing protein n=1 Tax=Chryseotalea sanaruensis TaxID=2482724 RepID=A0A401U6D9_9BACT|nr:BON domain-containing protein [Chryseotalea sanaruensis]GCC50422.1 BON domain-containing protein [Chryseotalea sanaruensis]